MSKHPSVLRYPKRNFLVSGVCLATILFASQLCIAQSTDDPFALASNGNTETETSQKQEIEELNIDAILGGPAVEAVGTPAAPVLPTSPTPEIGPARSVLEVIGNVTPPTNPLETTSTLNSPIVAKKTAPDAVVADKIEVGSLEAIERNRLLNRTNLTNPNNPTLLAPRPQNGARNQTQNQFAPIGRDGRYQLQPNQYQQPSQCAYEQQLRDQQMQQYYYRSQRNQAYYQQQRPAYSGRRFFLFR